MAHSQKKIMNNTFAKIYYTGLVAITLAFAAYTVAIGSANIANGQKVAELEKRQTVLSERQVTVQQEISQETSFAHLAVLAEEQGFVSTSQIVTVPTNTQVASR